MPITGTKKPKKVFSKVFSENDDSQWVYQSARGVQLAPGKAGYMTNIRPGGAVTVDLAVGNDLIAIEDLDNFKPAVFPNQQI
ncbi:MAG: hypothetical protein ACYTFY_21280 [Planctomycetota bacterium]|jgi:hypothetical protein